ncbi:spermatogenesis-associated protein 4 isoform X1 [Salminus brasiliensis]|uniref:spermatogenesis-associated protein 4 isoform X1 n=1 Tax=Salminus brasiliensis TaxID=930266 RepID=UPI003B8310DF
MAYSQPPKRTGLPREVLKWLQSLDLSVSPKNMRRDFSNGYLVAEIFSKFYPEDFPIHSFGNGTSLATKQGNWTQIEKGLMKQQLNLVKEALDGTVHCKPGAAEALVQEIYTLLTNKRLNTVQEGALDFTDRSYQEQLPIVARATASKAIKNNLRLSEELAEPNITANQQKIQAIIHRHVERRRDERNRDPSETHHNTPHTHPTHTSGSARGHNLCLLYWDRGCVEEGAAELSSYIKSRAGQRSSRIRVGTLCPAQCEVGV